MREKARSMIFIDGTNALVRLSSVANLKFRADTPPRTAIDLIDKLVRMHSRSRSWDVIRRYWFASYSGNDVYRKDLSSFLRSKQFEPVLFKRRSGREKGVDIALTMSMLVNAFNQNYDFALLFAGDEDYLGLVNEVKRYGPRVVGAFFENGLSEELSLACDNFARIPNVTSNHEVNQIYMKLVTEFENK